MNRREHKTWVKRYLSILRMLFLLNCAFFTYWTPELLLFLWDSSKFYLPVKPPSPLITSQKERLPPLCSETHVCFQGISLICFGCVLHLLHQRPFIRCAALALFLSQTKCSQPKSGRHRTDTGAARHTGRGAGGGAGTSKERGWQHAEIIQTRAGSTLVSSPNTPGWLLLQDHCICCSCSLAPSFQSHILLSHFIQISI